MTPRTLYLCRLLGIFLLILTAAEIVQRSALAETAIVLVRDPALLLICGMLTLVAGLAIVLAHNVWRGGAAAVLVTILGWLMLLKGAALVIIPAGSWPAIVQASRFADFYPVYGILPLVLGVYLTFAGFSARHRREV
jgi:putative exporter of polyketide antibiotics